MVESAPIFVSDLYAVNATFAAKAVVPAKSHAARQLRGLSVHCVRRGLEVRTVQCSDLAVPTIIAQANALKAAYIVIGSHGHGAVYDLVVGSTTQGVLRKARCPVLVVPVTPVKARARR